MTAHSRYPDAFLLKIMGSQHFKDAQQSTASPLYSDARGTFALITYAAHNIEIGGWGSPHEATLFCKLSGARQASYCLSFRAGSPDITGGYELAGVQKLSPAPKEDLKSGADFRPNPALTNAALNYLSSAYATARGATAPNPNQDLTSFLNVLNGCRTAPRSPEPNGEDRPWSRANRLRALYGPATRQAAESDQVFEQAARTSLFRGAGRLPPTLEEDGTTAFCAGPVYGIGEERPSLSAPTSPRRIPLDLLRQGPA